MGAMSDPGPLLVHVFALGGFPMLYIDGEEHEALPGAVPCGSLEMSGEELDRVVELLHRKLDAMQEPTFYEW